MQDAGSIPRADTAGLPWALAVVALALPALLAYNVPPSATFLNQAAAVVCWGGFLMVASASVAVKTFSRTGGLAALLFSLALLGAAALTAAVRDGLPWSLSASAFLTLLAAAFVVFVGGALASTGLGDAAFRAFCIGLLVAGLASAAIGVIQVYVPQWSDSEWIARSAIEGRAVGNLRQPNHLSSLLVWSIVAIVWLGQARAIRQGAALGMALLMLFVIVLTGSRTGAIGTLTLAAWGLLDRRMSRGLRAALVLSPVAYALLWLGATEWAHLTHHIFGGENRFSGAGDVSSSRFGIWSNTWDLIKAHPWFGVGFGEFNFAWTLTPFPHRPVAFFDHTHNLVLQFVVELGIPLAALVLGLLGWALFDAARLAIAAGGERHATDDSAPPYQRAALVIVLLVAVHSMLEYPLWYSYFLLPTAFAFGLCAGDKRRSERSTFAAEGERSERVGTGLGAPAATGTPADLGEAGDDAGLVAPASSDPSAIGRPSRFGNHPTRPLVLASMLMIGGGVLALYDYAKVVVIFSPPANATPLEARIAAGQRSVLFAHHADYAAATTEEPGRDLTPFKRAPHYLLDSRLMMAWAQALAASGDVDRARYIAARLREFHNEQAAPFFAPCNEPAKPGAELPFQCQPPQRSYTYEDFR